MNENFSIDQIPSLALNKNNTLIKIRMIFPNYDSYEENWVGRLIQSVFC